MLISMDNWIISQKSIVVGYEGDSNMIRLEIQTDLTDDWLLKFDVETPKNGSNVADMTSGENGLYYIDLTEEILYWSGKVYGQIRGFSGDKIAHSNTFAIFASDSINAIDYFNKEPTEVAQMERRLTDLRDSAEAAKTAIENMTVSAKELPEGSAPTVSKIPNADGTVNLEFNIPAGTTGPQGQQGLQGETGPSGNTPVRGVDFWTEADIAEIQSYIDTHSGITGLSVNSETGAFDIRYYNNVLQAKNLDGTWADIVTGSTGGGSYDGEMLAPLATSNFRVTPIDNCGLVFTWEDPTEEIYSADGLLLCKWKGTKLVMKLGGYPENIDDGTILVDSRIHSAYQNTGFTVSSGLTEGETYYFKLFPYSEIGGVNIDEANNASGVPVVKAYVTMTAIIDLSNSNPATCVSYADSAIEMTPGSVEWDSFFGYYPCIVKNGVETVKLNPNDYTKDIDGNTVNLASADVGDVMVAFPRRGLRMTRSGNLITIKMTDNPVSSDFDYYAHRRGNNIKDVFYIGAYESILDATGFRSWKSGTVPYRSNQNIVNTRNSVRSKGIGYDLLGFFQVTYLQAMYVLKYKNLDSQTAVGAGAISLPNGVSWLTIGGSEAYGMCSELIKATNPTYLTDGQHHIKCFGIEDLWGNIDDTVDGVYASTAKVVYASSMNFGTYTLNTSGDISSYTRVGTEYFANASTGPVSNVRGTSLGGFTAIGITGSTSTYFCDNGGIHPNTSLTCYYGAFGGASSYSAGIFVLLISGTTLTDQTYLGVRLMYL